MLYLNLLPVTFLIIIWSHQWIKPSGSVFLFLTSFLLFVISCFWALSLPYLPPSPQSRSSHHSFFHSTSDFHQGSLTGAQCKYFSHKSGIFFLINSNSHESALTCSILCRLRDILKHTLSNLFPFSQQQRFALPHFHGHCKPPFHSWPLLSTLQLVACFPTALTTACGLSEKERVRFGEEFLRGVGGWYLGHPSPHPLPEIIGSQLPRSFLFQAAAAAARSSHAIQWQAAETLSSIAIWIRCCAQYWAASKTHTETRAGCWEGFAAQERCSCCRLYYSGQRQYMGQNWEYSFDSFLWNMKPLLRINVHFQLCLNCCLISLSF